MEFPVDQFELYIDETILKRGLGYFKKGHVTSFEEITKGEFEALVEGSDLYTVILKVQNKTVIENSCTCPYDFGSVCKHVAAVLFYMQQEELGLNNQGVSKSPKRKTTPKKKTVSEQVDELLKSLSHNDLKVFIKEQSLKDASFRRTFLAGFMYKNAVESPSMYRHQINSILKNAMGRDRYIPWSRMKSAGNAVFEFLGTATKHHEKGNYMSAIYICEAVAEEMVKAFDFADDSDGDIGGNIEAAFDILWQISSEEIPEEARVYLMEQCINHYKKGAFNGWDWQFTLIEIASNVAKSENEAEKIFNLLELQGISEYDMEQVVKIQHGLIKKMKGSVEAEKFMEQNLAIPDLRRKAIDKSMKDKKFDKAISLARDGIELDLKEKPGLAMEWYDWLLRIALVQKDSSKIIEYARSLFIDGFRHDQNYYDILKKQIDQSEWNSFVEGIIEELLSSKGWSKTDVVAKIFITEQWWDRLLKLITEDSSLHRIQSYEKYLADKYPKELVLLYENDLQSFMERASDRGQYKDACRILRRMIKLGGRDRVNSLISRFRKEYPRRIALMDELDKV